MRGDCMYRFIDCQKKILVTHNRIKRIPFFQILMNVRKIQMYASIAATTRRAVLFVSARLARFYWQTSVHVLVHSFTLASI